MPITETPTLYSGNNFFTRKVLATFLNFFASRIYVERYDEAGDIFKYIRPPVHHANRSRFITLTQGSNQSNTFNVDNLNALDLNYILPRMAVSITGMNYNPERRVSKFQRVKACAYDEVDGTLARVLSPVPYTLSLDLSILTKSIDDTFQIIEQIVPYFTPSLSFDVKFIEGFAPESVSYTLTSVSPDSNDEYGVTDERVFLSTLNFETNVNYYYIKRDSSIIKKIIADYYLGKDEDYERIQRFEFNADNLSPVTTVAERAEEPVTTTTTDY